MARAAINKTTVLWIIGRVLLLIGAIGLISWAMVMGGFFELERGFVQKNISRMIEVIEDRKNNLQVKLTDWANWDDTYVFIQDKNEAYIKSNLTSLPLENLGIDMMGFFNERGECVRFMDRGADDTKGFLPPQGLQPYLTPGSVVLDQKEGGFLSGMILAPEGPLLVVARPILKSDGTGPVRGTMVFIKRIDTDELKRWGAIVKADLDLQRMEEDALPSDFKIARDGLLTGKDSVIAAIDSRNIAGYLVLQDAFGKKNMILKILMPREITQFGYRTLGYFILSLFGVGLIFGLVVYMPLEKEIAGKVRAEKELNRLMGQLQDEHKNLEKIFDSAHEGLMLVDSNFNVKLANHVILDLGGQELFSVVDHPIGDALSCVYAKGTQEGCGDAQECRTCALRQALETVLKASRSVKGAVFSRMIRLASGEKRLIWLEVNASAIEIKGQQHVLVSLANITDRKQLEDQRREAVRFLETLIDAIPNAVYFKDINGVYRGCNRAFASSLGKTRNEIIGKTVFDIAPQELAEKYHAKDLELMANPGVQTYENKFQLADGTLADAIFSKASFTGPDGKVAGIIGVMMDITERKKREEEDKKRTYEFEVFYKASVGREERIIALKDQVEKLKHELEKRRSG